MLAIGSIWTYTDTQILLGWSLGGFLSLAIARMMASKPAAKFSIAGMLIIDSPHHLPRSKIQQSTVEPELSAFPELVHKMFASCDVMLQDWELPKWDAPTGEDKETRIATGGRSFKVQPGQMLYKPLNGTWRPVAFERYEHTEISEKPKAPPPAVLIRCVRHVNKATESDNPALVDIHRDEVLLGWAGNYPDFIRATIDVDADHYDIFDRSQQAKVSKTRFLRMSAAC